MGKRGRGRGRGKENTTTYRVKQRSCRSVYLNGYLGLQNTVTAGQAVS